MFLFIKILQNYQFHKEKKKKFVIQMLTMYLYHIIILYYILKTQGQRLKTCMQLLLLVMMQAYLYLCQQNNSPLTSNTSSLLNI